ncbi:MAG: hypothetical protein AAFU85_02505 [Planctomycetota bacterium]
MDRHHDSALEPPPLPVRVRTTRDVFFYTDAPPRVRPGDFSQKRLFPRIAEAKPAAARAHRRMGLGVSALLHAALLLLIAVLMAPMHVVGGGENVLVMRLGLEDTAETQNEPIAMTASEPVDAPAEVAPSPAPAAAEVEATSPSIKKEPEPDEAGPPGGESAQPASASGSATQGSSADSDGASGSFFGISAQGHEFVYVLDRSSSMRGSRYRRAVAELIRSVNQLSDEQSFYVFLFSNKTVSLFGEESEPGCVAATDKNKERLRKWLERTAPDGNTDPREALYLALRLKPSAVFMLSDGEFTEDKPVWIGDLPAATSPRMVESISQRFVGKLAPIHTVAYEDPKSKVNLQRLSEITGGSFRFVKFRPRTHKQMLTEVQETLRQPPGPRRGGELDKLFVELTRSRVTKKTRSELHDLLSKDSHQMVAMLDELDESVLMRRTLQMDQLSSMDSSLPLESALFDELIERWNRSEKAERLSVLHDRLRHRANRARVSQVVGKLIFDEAEIFRKAGNTSAAYAKYHEVAEKHVGSDFADLSRQRCEEAEASIRTRVEEWLDAGRRSDAIRHLREGVTKTTEPRTKQMWMKMLTETLDTSFAKAEQARRERENLDRRRILSEIESGFDDPREMERYRQQFLQKENTAARIYRDALLHARSGKPQLALQQFEMIVRLYPHSEAATQARRYLPASAAETD